MITANFSAYSTYVTDSLFQWDQNRVLRVTGLNLKVKPEVHFSNANMNGAIPVQADLVNHVVVASIPNSLLQEPLRIYAHIGIYEGDEFKVVELVEIPVKPRKRPADYELAVDDFELYSFKRLENMIKNINDTWVDKNEEQVHAYVTSWLDEHPEATTTVQDGALTEVKFSDELKLQAIKDYVTPQMFGAKGDGVTDDTAAVQAALAASNVVYLPRGRYLISDTIDIPAGKTLQMEGYIESLAGKDPADFADAGVAVIYFSNVTPAFQLHDGSKLLGGLVYAPASLKAVLLDVGVETMKNVEVTAALLGERTTGSVGVYFQGSTGTTGSLCFSTFGSTIHGFQYGYFVDRPSGGLPWFTFCDFSGTLSENYQAFTHNLTNYGNAFGSSRYRFNICGGYVWENKDRALLEMVGDSLTIDCKFSDVGVGHKHVYGLDLSHVQKSTVHGLPFNSPLIITASKNRNNFTFGEMGTVETANGTLSYIVNGQVAHVFYNGDVPKGNTNIAVPFYNLVFAKTANGQVSMETQQHFPNIILRNSGTATVEGVSLSMSVIVH